MSCSTLDFTVLTCADTACCVASSLEDAFQPNAKPPIAISPRTMMAGRCQEAPPLFSIYSSLIANLSPLDRDAVPTPKLSFESCKRCRKRCMRAAKIGYGDDTCYLRCKSLTG